MSQLQNIIEHLKLNNDVDAVFLTGSHGANKKPYSDIDLVIILKENVKQIESIFTWIDGTFADIYFFDLKNIKNIMSSESLFANPLIGSRIENTMDSRLYNWIKKSSIQFDKSGDLTKLKSKQIELKVGEADKEISWNNINYNFEVNTRYFNSGDSVYHEALEMRLLYSVSQLITGYFSFRGIQWEGEKNAVKYLKDKDPKFYENFILYSKSSTLENKFKYYKQMVESVFSGPYHLWTRNEVLPKLRGRTTKLNDPELIEFWEKLIS